MNTAIVRIHLNSDLHEQALDSKRGLVFEYTFWVERTYYLL